MIQAICRCLDFDRVDFSIEFHQAVEGFHPPPVFLLFRNENHEGIEDPAKLATVALLCDDAARYPENSNFVP
jgi:hypothetical protein